MRRGRLGRAPQSHSPSLVNYNCISEFSHVLKFVWESQAPLSRDAARPMRMTSNLTGPCGVMLALLGIIAHGARRAIGITSTTSVKHPPRRDGCQPHGAYKRPSFGDIRGSPAKPQETCAGTRPGRPGSYVHMFKPVPYALRRLVKTLREFVLEIGRAHV